MKISKKIGIVFILISIFMFKIDVVSAKETTCEYEMYPVMYNIVDGKPQPASRKSGSESYSTLAKIVFKGTDKKNYTITSKSKFGFTESHPNIKDKNFAKNVTKEGKCPSYIARSTEDNLKIIKDETSFLKLVNTFTTNTNENYYPLVLVKQDGKATKDSDVVINKAVSSWNKIMKDSNYSSNENTLQYEKIFQNSVKKSSIYGSTISKNTTWSNYIQAKEDAKTLESKENIQKNASSDYCYYYCSSVYCKNQKEGTPKEQCVNSCNVSIKPKCDSSYNACVGVPSSDLHTCIRSELSKNGLDSNYVDIRTQEQTELAKEIEKLKKSVKTGTATKVKIEFEPYKLTCDDVKIFHDIWVVIIIIAPALVIIMGTLDFGQAVISSSEDKIQKAWKKFPKRILAVVLLILIPVLVSLLLSLSTDEGARDTSLMYCIINGGE